MSVFAYAGYGPDGRRRRGWIEADTTKQARIRLAAQGVLASRLTPATVAVRLKPAERAEFYRGVGVLVQSGFPLERTLGLMMDESPGAARTYGLLAGLRDRIREGAGLATALPDLCRGVPRFERAALQASERAGLQGEMLVRLADYLDAQRTVNDRLRAALTYPVFVLCAGLGLASLVLFVVVPRALALLLRVHGEVPRNALLTAAVGRATLLTLLLAGALALLAAGWLRLRGHRPDRAARLEQWLVRVPVVGAIQIRLWGLRFAQTMGLLLQAGGTVVDALPLAGLATGSAWIGLLSEAQAERVRHGASLSAAIRAMPPLAPTLAEWVRVGETAGNLQAMLEQAGRRCQQSYEQRLAKALSLLEPALILLVGVVVLVVSLTVLTPLLDIARRAAGA